MIYTIPLQPVPAQQLSCTLNAQDCSFWIRQLSSGLYLDLKINNSPAIMGALCLNNNDLVRNPTSPLNGALFFTDTQGNNDPYYSGLGSRFVLQYEDTTNE